MPFDVGSFELLIILIVALIVIGPARLPEVAAKIGKWIGKINRMASDFKNEINRELKAEELKKTLQKQADVAGIHEIIEDAGETIKDVTADAPGEETVKSNQTDKSEL